MHAVISKRNWFTKSWPADWILYKTDRDVTKREMPSTNESSAWALHSINRPTAVKTTSSAFAAARALSYSWRTADDHSVSCFFSACFSLSLLLRTALTRPNAPGLPWLDQRLHCRKQTQKLDNRARNSSACERWAQNLNLSMYFAAVYGDCRWLLNWHRL